ERCTPRNFNSHPLAGLVRPGVRQNTFAIAFAEKLVLIAARYPKVDGVARQRWSMTVNMGLITAAGPFSRRIRHPDLTSPRATRGRIPESVPIFLSVGVLWKTVSPAARLTSAMHFFTGLPPC